MQNLKLITTIGKIEIKKRNRKVISLRLPKNPPSSLKPAKMGVTRYKNLFSLSPDLSIGTCFQRNVWKYIRKIPFGNTVTYKNIADDLKLGRAYRAVGQACRSNPVPIVVPCHRVISSNGALGGYSWGARWKKFLLELEKDRI